MISHAYQRNPGVYMNFSKFADAELGQTSYGARTSAGTVLDNPFPIDEIVNLSQSIFSNAFVPWQFSYFNSNAIEVCS